MKNIKTILIVIFLNVTVLWGSVAVAVPSSFSYQGRILKANGQGLEYNDVNFKFEIVSPNGACVIYQEQVSGISMVNSGGVFDISIGNNSVQYIPSGVSNFLDVFKNAGSFECGSCSPSGPGFSCSAGSSFYNPAVDDIRKLRVSFHDGTGWRTISPDNVIRAVPYAAQALAAQKIGETEEADILTRALAPTCVAANSFLQWNGTDFDCVAASVGGGGTVTEVSSANAYITVATGTSTPALTLNVGTSAGTVAAGNDARFTDARTPTGTAGGDLTGTYPNPTVAQIQGRAVNSAAPAATGQALLWSGTEWHANFVRAQDLTNAWGGSPMIPTTACSANESMTWSVITDRFTCQTIGSLNASAITAGTVSPARLGSGTTDNTTYLRGDGTWAAVASGSGDITQGGNAFGVPVTIGTNDAFGLNLEVQGTPRMTLLPNGAVGIGTASPAYGVHIMKDSFYFTSTDGVYPYIYAVSGNIGIGESGTPTSRLSVTQSVTTSTNATAMTINSAGNSNTAAITKTALRVYDSNTWLGAGSTNIGLDVDIDGGVLNYAALFRGGNVGMGNTNPSTMLDLSGALTIRGMAAPGLSPAGQGRLYFDSTSNKFRVSQNGAAYQELTVGGFMNNGNSFGANAVLGTDDNFGLSLETNNTPRMTFLNNGNIGMGSATNPTDLFEMSFPTITDGSTGKNISINAQSSNEVGGDILLKAGTYGGSWAGGFLTLGGSGWMPKATTLAAADGNNNGDPGHLFLRAGETANSGGGFVNIAGGRSANGVGGNVFISGGTSNNTANYGNVILGVTNAGLVRGNVLVGTTATPTAKFNVATNTDQDAIRVNMGTNFGRMLDLEGSRGLNYSARMHNDNSGGTVEWQYRVGNADLWTRMTWLGNESGRFDFIPEGNTSSPILSMLTTNGNVGIGQIAPTHPLHMGSGAHVTAAGTWTNASDLRLKRDVASISYGLTEVLRLNPVSYVMKSNQEKQIGFIAQEVRDVIPEVVSGSEGDMTKGETLGISYGNLVAVTVQAIQDLYQMIVDLKETKAEASELEKVKAENALMKQYLCQKDPAAPFCQK